MKTIRTSICIGFGKKKNTFFESSLICYSGSKENANKEALHCIAKSLEKIAKNMHFYAYSGTSIPKNLKLVIGGFIEYGSLDKS